MSDLSRFVESGEVPQFLRRGIGIPGKDNSMQAATDLSLLQVALIIIFF